jgi:hypothetical protein
LDEKKGQPPWKMEVANAAISGSAPSIVVPKLSDEKVYAENYLLYCPSISVF